MSRTEDMAFGPDEDLDGDFWDDDEEDESNRDSCINCGEPSAFDTCAICGSPLCPRCYECGGGVCDDQLDVHPALISGLF